jgi:hypothetical protein
MEILQGRSVLSVISNHPAIDVAMWLFADQSHQRSGLWYFQAIMGVEVCFTWEDLPVTRGGICRSRLASPWTAGTTLGRDEPEWLA